ncbi:hypothetical protein HPB51_017382 [Rhipicephalus microplus]|uniref:C17orf113 probable zinc finger domain-containing protein n=1 Tax=Rhipicephalus microplus TaxID=6941 RepID=A0A9J6DW41_RHIMP|nr:hypothetical protein HPB51_017382 [Rhipicephalus microplus]
MLFVQSEVQSFSWFSAREMAARKKAAQPSLLSFFSRKATEEVTSSDPQEQTTQPEAPDVDAVEPLTSPVSQGLKSSAHDGGSSTPSVEATCDETNACEMGKQAAVFNASWIRDHPWFFYDNIKGGMFCKLCIKYNKRPLEKPVWNEQPCKRIRLDSVRKHDACHSHRDAVTLEANSKVAVSPLEKVQCSVSRNAMRQAFASMYYLCKHRIPHTTNFETLLGLLSLLGLDVKAQITAGKNATYCSQRSIQEMVTCLSDVIEDKILCELRQSEHYALMFDETTNCATVEQLVIHCRYIFGGELRVKFLTMIDVLGNHEPHQGDERALALNATNIACAVEDFMNKKGLLFGALRGIGTDGAPVMTGKKGGAVKLLIDKQKALTAPHSFQAVGVHCAAHKLNLAALQAAKSIPYISKFKELLQQLYNFYASSSVRTAGLSAVQNILESEQRGGKIIEPSATRWLSVGGSCTAIRNNLSAIIISLSREAEQRSDIRAAGLLKFVTNAKFVGTLLMMCDLLPAIDKLSRTLQTSSLQVDLIQGLIKSCIKTLETQSNIQTKVKDFCVSHDIEVTITEES